MAVAPAWHAHKHSTSTSTRAEAQLRGWIPLRFRSMTWPPAGAKHWGEKRQQQKVQTGMGLLVSLLPRVTKFAPMPRSLRSKRLTQEEERRLGAREAAATEKTAATEGA